MKMSIRHITEIIRLSKKNIDELRKLNPHGAYEGKELTKPELIFQIVFYCDAPKPTDIIELQPVKHELQQGFTVSIKDGDEQISAALRILQLNLNSRQIETVLNLYELISSSKTDVSMKQVRALGKHMDEIFK